jgi:hypothetical protein
MEGAKEDEDFIPVDHWMEEQDEGRAQVQRSAQMEERKQEQGQEQGQGPAGARQIVDCELCKAEKAKYCCPGCSMRTCSLQCSKQHKALTGCTGQRDRLAFVPLEQFDDQKLLSGVLLLPNLLAAASWQADLA